MKVVGFDMGGLVVIKPFLIPCKIVILFLCGDIGIGLVVVGKVCFSHTVGSVRGSSVEGREEEAASTD